jgi:hypothetical protein
MNQRNRPGELAAGAGVLVARTRSGSQVLALAFLVLVSLGAQAAAVGSEVQAQAEPVELDEMIEPDVEASLAVDPDDLAAMLADLEALGGVLDSDDLALLRDAYREQEPGTGPVFRPRGEWLLAANARDGSAPRLEARLRQGGRRLRFGGRVQRSGTAQQGVLWLTAAGSQWQVAGGAGSLGHGSGLLSAPLGARSSLTVDASLLPSAPGWRPSQAVTMPQRLDGLALDLSAGAINLQFGRAQDQDERPAQHLRLALGDHRRLSLGLLGLQRDQALASGLDLRVQRGPWRLTGEAAVWRLQADQAAARAWVLTVGWRRHRVLAEFQAAGSRAAGGMPAAQRPACLPGWFGEGWAWRLRARTVAGLQVGLAGGGGEDRHAQTATGRRRTRHQLAMTVHGPWLEEGRWELRWRRLDEAYHGWDPDQPWLPAGLDRRQSRTWLTGLVEQPLGGGTGQFSWRRLEESGQARNLLGVRWQRTTARLRWRVGWQAAWGEPLNLVTVSVPVSSLIRLRHWGTWDSALLAGVEGRGRWRWQLGGELRRRSPDSGGGMVGEGRVQWGRRF